jgi:hypothetical protein
MGGEIAESLMRVSASTSGQNRDEVLVRTLDELAPAVFALMILFPVMHRPIFLGLRRSALWTRISDDHRFLLTSTASISVFGQQ